MSGAARSRICSTAGFRLIQLSNEHLVAGFLPELGGKMISLKSVSTNREFLLQPPHRPYRRARYGASFSDYDTSGWDECCPTVSECTYPAGEFAGAIMPDHGDLWSAAWESDVRDGELLLEVRGRSLPYVFNKQVRLESDAIVFSYEIASTGSTAFAFLWSAHPLLAVQPGCRILLPKDISQVFVNWSNKDRLGEFGDTCRWPIACTKDGTEADLSELTTIKRHTADKLFTPRLSSGHSAVFYPDPDECLTFQFDSQAVPYLGIWICQGGWPSPDRGHFAVALEPCTGRPDSLAEAIRRGECDVLQPGERKKWQVSIEAVPGFQQMWAS